MVAGFFCAVILINVLGRLIGTGFEIICNGIGQTKFIGIVGTVSMCILLGAVVIMAANKFFSLIHYIPEHVTNWIGQQMHSLGEKEDQASAKAVLAGSTNALSESSREFQQRLKKPKGNIEGSGSSGSTGTSQPSGSSAHVAGRPAATERSLQS